MVIAVQFKSGTHRKRTGLNWNDAITHSRTPSVHVFANLCHRFWVKWHSWVAIAARSSARRAIGGEKRERNRYRLPPDKAILTILAYLPNKVTDESASVNGKRLNVFQEIHSKSTPTPNMVPNEITDFKHSNIHAHTHGTHTHPEKREIERHKQKRMIRHGIAWQLHHRSRKLSSVVNAVTINIHLGL